MKKNLLYILFSFSTLSINAQMTQDSIAGEYYLRSVMETASGFKLNPDSSFEFFFSYGALDRSGSGKWSMAGKNRISFNSASPPGQNFALVSSSKVKEDFTIIRIKEANPVFLSSIYAIVKSGGKREEGLSNKSGEIRLPLIEADSIQLFFEFAPERPALFTVAEKSHNLFEFKFEPWVMEVFFKDFILETDGKQLKGPHPLLKEGIYHYDKN